MFILHSDAGSFSEIDLNTFDFGTTREVAVGSGTVWGKLAVAKVCLPLRAIFLSSGPSEKPCEIWLGVRRRNRHRLQLTALQLLSRKASRSKIQLPLGHHDNASCTTDGFPLQRTAYQRIDRIYHIHMYLYDKKTWPISPFTISDCMELESQFPIGPWTASICSSPPRTFLNEGSAVGDNGDIVHANTFSRI